MERITLEILSSNEPETEIARLRVECPLLTEDIDEQIIYLKQKCLKSENYIILPFSYIGVKRKQKHYHGNKTYF